MITVHAQHQEASSTTMAESTPDTETKPATPDFLAFLAGVNKGRTANELGEKLQELVAAIENTGKGGTLVLKIAIKPAGKTNSDAVIVTDEVLLKAPKATPRESFFFPDSDHNLLRNNPNQADLFD